MLRYVIRRILWLIPTMIGVAVLIFTIMFFIPGDPVTIMNPNATQEEIEITREKLGLNGSYIERLWDYASGVFFRLDFGVSFVSGTSVTGEILSRFPRTFMLAIASMVLSVAIGKIGRAHV